MSDLGIFLFTAIFTTETQRTQRNNIVILSVAKNPMSSNSHCERSPAPYGAGRSEAIFLACLAGISRLACGFLFTAETQRNNLTIFNTLSATSAISMVNKSYCYTVSQREGMVFPFAKILLFISSYDKIYLEIYRREFLWP